jgi:hypothetical protein
MAKKLSQYLPGVGKRTDGIEIDGGDINLNVLIDANSVDRHIFVAPYACRLVSVREIHSVVGGAAAAVRPRKITDTSAPGAAASATVKELTTAAIDLTATINVTQVATLTAIAATVTNSDIYLAAGDKLALDFSGTLTGLIGNLTLHLKRI